MRRSSISLVLVWSLLFGGALAPAGAQFAPAPNQPLPADPQTQNDASWPQVQSPDGSYAQNSYPPSSYPQNGYPQSNYPQSNYPQASYPSSGAPNDTVDQQHAVARLSVADGEVNVRRGDGGGVVAAAPNAPVLAQDHVQTAQDGRAELELDYGNVVRVGPGTDLGFADLQYRRYQMQLGAGAIVYRVLRDSGAQAEIDTPSIAVHPVQPGEYRVTVYDDGSSQITVRSGTADIVSPRGSQSLAAGQSLLVRGNANDPEFQDVAAPGLDALDSWSEQRDQPLLAAQSYRYVPADVAGAEDLDRYGRWESSQYGEVWQPNDPGPDWSPYSDGSWSYEPYYGWTWVDASPWGWAPFHYGRWFVNAGHWCWWPGRVGFSVGWSPAVVGFFGVGAGLGWVALAPFEEFHHWWGGGFGVSIGFGFGGGWRGGGIWNTYRNCGYRGGALWAGPHGFGEHRGRFAPIERAQLNSARFVGGRLPVSPTRASYAFSNRAAFRTPARLAAVQNRSFFRAPQGSFNRPGAAFNRPAQTRGFGRASEPNSPAGFARMPQGGVNQPRAGAAGNFGTIHGQPPSRSNGGWQSFGDARSGSRLNFSPGQEGNGGWHNFGESQHYPNAQRGIAPRPYATAPQQPQQQRYSPGVAPRPNYNTPSYQQPRYAAPSFNSQPRYNPPSFNQRYNAPSYQQQQPRFSGPSYNPRYSGPSYQHYSAPSYQQHFGGGGGGGQHYSQPHYSAPSNSGGGGGFHGGGGGGGHSSGGGGGGHSSGGGGHHR